MQCHITPHYIKPQQNPQTIPQTRRTMPPRAGDVDLRSANNAALQMVVCGVLGIVVEAVSEWKNADKFREDGTALQKALATFLLLIRLVIGALSVFSFLVFVYSVPSRFKGLSMIMCFLCLCGALYFGDVIRT